MKKRWLYVVGLIILISIACLVVHRKLVEKRLSNLDIESILIRENDLPSGFFPGQIEEDRAWERDEFVQAKWQDILTYTGGEAGKVGVYLFSNESDKGQVLGYLSHVESQEGIIPYPVTGIGDCADCTTAFATDWSIYIVFERCRSVGAIILDIRHKDQYDFDYLVNHARRLDQELARIACGF